jgi:hypothetical protein
MAMMQALAGTGFLHPACGPDRTTAPGAWPHYVTRGCAGSIFALAAYLVFS